MSSQCSQSCEICGVLATMVNYDMEVRLRRRARGKGFIKINLFLYCVYKLKIQVSLVCK